MKKLWKESVALFVIFSLMFGIMPTVSISAAEKDTYWVNSVMDADTFTALAHIYFKGKSKIRIKGKRSQCCHAGCKTGDAAGTATAQTGERMGYGIVIL